MERRAIVVRGTVQGVGFRPFIYGLATGLHLRGLVRNQAGCVQIEVEGPPARLEEFLQELPHRAPPLARIEHVSWQQQPLRGDAAFRIEHSISADVNGEVFVSPDVATCRECLAELFDPSDRRFHYPFLNCTNCGPRLTIIQDAPYDRQRTTMRAFELCPQCRAEYENPADRRFHAQPVACPACGPQLEAVRPDGVPLQTDDALTATIEVLRRGGIAAIKGLGGYHLACDAGNQGAVCELRRRKHRDDKPLAIMVPDIDAARRLCTISTHEQQLLESPRRPIVLLKRHSRESEINNLCDAVAPDNPYLGIMLPYTPLHHLLLNALDGIPLVMTSGNRTDEPIAYLDDDARNRLGDIADIILRHNRPIYVRCDDSITRSLDGIELPVRRSRGYAPQPVRLPFECELPTLAVGGQLKGTFALGTGRHAIMSLHLGDLDHLEAYQQFERDIPLYERLFQIQPELIVHDLHPDYSSTAYARTRAATQFIRTLAVQHHHAHMASCMAEHGLDEPAIGVVLDGTGFGVDERTGEAVVWGGEFLVGDYRSVRRAAHLRYVAMPGGDKAAKEPWRMAASHLADAGCDADILKRRIPASAYHTIESMLARRFNSPLTSSTGRLFDAIASIAGVRDYMTYEAQAAMQLEWLATENDDTLSYPFEIIPPSDGPFPLIIDTRPIIRGAWEDAEANIASSVIARRFHTTLVNVIQDSCVRIREQFALDCVVLSGGVFLNALLTREVMASLRSAGFRVFRHQLVPPNDGGLSLGQVAIAARLSQAADSSADALQRNRTIEHAPSNHVVYQT